MPLPLTEIPKRAIILDTETTGFTPNRGDRVCEVAAIELIDGVPSGRSFHEFINPGIPMPSIAASVHGLTDKFLADKPKFEAIAPALGEFLGCGEAAIWAHNASFDRRFIEFEMSEAGLSVAHEFKCSLKLARRIPHGGGDSKLATLARLAGHRWGARGAHSALEDVRALGVVLTKLLWPLAITAGDQLKPAGKKPERKATAQESRAIKLPKGFRALTSKSDPRIRRYDELSLDGLLHARGKRWDAAEERRLIEDFLVKQLTIPALVWRYGRSPRALFQRLEKLGVVESGHPYSEI